MKRYSNRGYNYRPYQRRKRIRINKIRFTVFILCCLVILFGAGFGIKALLTDRVDIMIGMTDDLNPAEGESLYRVLLSWEPLEVKDYKNIQITVNGKEYILDPGLTRFEIELTEPDQMYDVTFKAKKKGLVFSRKLKKVIQTFEDNEVLDQSVSNLKIQDNILSFEHIIQKKTEIPFNLKSISYEGIDMVNHINSEGKIEIIEQDTEKIKQKVSIPLDVFKESPTVSIKMKTLVKDIALLTPVKDMDLQIDEVNVEPYRLVFEKNNILLVNDNIEHYDYKSHDFYAESLYINLTSNDENATYQLTDLSGRVIKDEPYHSQDHSGINLADLSEGQYFIKFNQLPVYVSEPLSDTWYTVMRDGKANQITLQLKNGQLSLKVEKIDHLPDNVYDILIDPGHGGLDGGTVAKDLTEAEEALKISKYIASRLEDHGLKVKLTRTEDVDPAGPGNFDYGKSSFFDEGRVEQVYRYQTKYMLSNHLNSFDGSLEGFEVYSSVAANNDWASRVAKALIEAGQGARDSEKSEFRVSEGSYKKYYLCTGTSYDIDFGCKNDYMDYLYIIRETGGKISQSSALIEYNENYTEIPNYGAETLLIEYAYLDNNNDYNEWINDWQAWGEAVVQATVEYLGIAYKK